jgi:hypothetical protein
MSTLVWIPMDTILPVAIRVMASITVLLLAAFILALLLGRRDAAVRHGIWLCALLAALVSPVAIVGADLMGIRLATIAWPTRRPATDGYRAMDPSVAGAGSMRNSPADDGSMPPFSDESMMLSSHRAAPRATVSETAPLPADPGTDESKPEAGTTHAIARASTRISEPDEDVPAADWPYRLGQLAVALWALGVVAFLG